MIELKDILDTIKKWKMESENFRNDGWFQLHYKNNIDEVSSLIKSFDNNDKKKDYHIEYKTIDNL